MNPLTITKMSGFATASGQSERECPVCGKRFSPTIEHAYKAGTGANRKFVCSYTCQRAWEKNPDVLKKGIKKQRSEGNNKVAVRVVETGELFDSIVACAKGLNTSTFTVGRCIYYGKTVKGLHIERVEK